MAKTVHLAYKTLVGPAIDGGMVVAGRRLYAPLDLVDRLGASRRIASWRDGKAFEAIAQAVARAHEALIARVQPLAAEGVAEGDARFVAALQVGSFELAADEAALLRALVDGAGDESSFEERYAAARLSSLELRIFAPICEALSTPLVEPLEAAGIPS